MVAGRLTPRAQEWAARFLVLLLLLAVPLAIVAAGRPDQDAVTLHASMPETGGWQPDHLTARVGQPLHLRLTSDDVVHGFVVHSFKVGAGPDGRAHDSPEVEVKPGQIAELSLSFDEPGTYTYTCTRWCGPNHWRMLGTIEVVGEEGDDAATPAAAPLYAQLGLDIDAPHPAPAVPQQTPSAGRGESLNLSFPQSLLAREGYLTQSPAEAWLAMRDMPQFTHLSDGDLWDAVAYLWRRHTSAEKLALGETLYSQNCAACHGENGEGDGVFAGTGGDSSGQMQGQFIEAPTDFTDPALLGASYALLEGKIVRGGMGTGMPAWGAIFSDEELQALLDYLWTFQFPREAR